MNEADWLVELDKPDDDYWAKRRPYIVSSGQVWIGEPGTHHDSAPPAMGKMSTPGSSWGEIFEDKIWPYWPDDAQDTSLVEEAWRNHPERSLA